MTQSALEHKKLTVAEMLSMHAPLISMVQLHTVVYLELGTNQCTGHLVGPRTNHFRGLGHVLENLEF